ncbi:MAG TPA: tetratricopeptide repeat protein [Terrimicrobiaceae bacterium]|nr:tetratricopeptide repeat protein [Terrimicrobiaceae bacterium]
MKSEKDLPESQRATWLKAMSAMELRNYAYAIQLLHTLLRAHPDFLLGRQLARKAAAAKFDGKRSVLGSLSSASLSLMKVQSQVKRDPVAALDPIEKMLEADPYNPQANQLLKEAALAARMPELAIFALETIVGGHPRDTKTMHELARLYMENSQPAKAGDVYGKILEMNPNDLAAVKGGKDAAAAASMQRGGWEREGTTYRDLIRDKEQAIALEQQARVYRGDEMIDFLLGELSEKYIQDPENLDTARRIAELYEEKNDLENAVTWFSYAAQLSQYTDFALVRKVSDLRIKQFDASIAGLEEALAGEPDGADTPERAAQLEELKRQRAVLFLDEAKKRVERNPTDLQLRFELGEILVSVGNYKDAISELQRARQNPNVRLRAMNLLGKCYTERKMFDLAANILSAAASELPQMDNVKKEIVYNLGLVYEKMSQEEKSIECMKQIYEVDYGYRDVAERVESSYGEAV